MSTTALAIRQAGALAADVFGDEYEAIKNGIAPGLTDVEYDYLAAVERRTGLSLLDKQFYGIKRSVYNRESGRYEMALGIQTAIDGFRLLAERTGKYRGQVGPFWCGADGAWGDVWLKNEPPAAAKVGVLHADFSEPLWAVAVWDSYVQLTKDGKPVNLWQKMPDVMLAKCAESLAIRKAFPRETSGIYTTEEMMQAENERRAEPQTLRATVAAATPAVTALPSSRKASNIHQHAQLRSLAEHGFTLGAALAAYGYESLEELDVEQAKELIIRGRAEIRTANGGATRASQEQPEPPQDLRVVEHAAPDTSFVLSAAQISLFWATGAQEGWTQEAKRFALRQLFPERIDSDGTVSIKSLSRSEFDGMVALFKGERALVTHEDGTVTLAVAGPPEDEREAPAEA